MKLSLNAGELRKYVKRLLVNHLPDSAEVSSVLSDTLIQTALSRIEHCFSRIHQKYYTEDGRTAFDHMNGDHMASLLYFLSNSAWREHEDPDLAKRLFYLNKILHGVDLFYSVEMPDVFKLVHPLGSVLGKAQYGNYLVVYQNVTVGADTDVYPRFGEGVILFSKTSVIGDCKVGSNVVFAANSMIVDSNVTDDTVVVGQYPDQQYFPNERSVRQRSFEQLP